MTDTDALNSNSLFYGSLMELSSSVQGGCRELLFMQHYLQ
jgi:hypothetical protein